MTQLATQNVTAVLSMLHEPADRNSATRTFRGDPVLAWTLERVRPGDIILLHDAPEAPGGRLPLGPAMLEGLLQGLRARGLAPVTISALLSG